jgi:hypothetical protein
MFCACANKLVSIRVVHDFSSIEALNKINTEKLFLALFSQQILNGFSINVTSNF